MIQLVSKCGELGGEGIQLAVLRALLTIATAEHFIVHGDCLMQVGHINDAGSLNNPGLMLNVKHKPQSSKVQFEASLQAMF